MMTSMTPKFQVGKTISTFANRNSATGNKNNTPSKQNSQKSIKDGKLSGSAGLPHPRESTGSGKSKFHKPKTESQKSKFSFHKRNFSLNEN